MYNVIELANRSNSFVQFKIPGATVGGNRTPGGLDQRTQKRNDKIGSKREILDK